jgi:hypothetical protein
MNRPQQELTLKNVLADPMVKIAMAADDVDPHELAAMLSCVAEKLKHPRTHDLRPCAYRA